MKSQANLVLETIADCEILSSKFKTPFEKFDCRQMSEQAKARVEDEIRSIIPQKRGAVVTSRGMILPLSGKKKLNLKNTPILLVEEAGRPAFVFPCRVEETYYGLREGIAYLQANWPRLPPLNGLGETELAHLIMREPELLENGLHDPQAEVDTLAGKIDIVFHDANGKLLLVEVERVADDAPLGQILRLCAAYEKNLLASTGSVRGMIACLRPREYIQDAAKRAGIEVKIIKMK